MKVLPGTALTGTHTLTAETLAPGPAAALLFGYVAVFLAGAGVLFARRDA